MLKMDLSDEHSYGYQININQLSKNGISSEKIEKIKQVIREYQKQEQELETKSLDSNRMNMFQKQHNGIDYKDKMGKFFPER